jgi:hypothetical protein
MNHMISKSVMNKINIKRQNVSAIAIGAFVIIALLILHIASLDSVSHLSGGWVPCHTPMGSPVTRGRRLVDRPILAYDFSAPPAPKIHLKMKVEMKLHSVREG